MVGRLGGWNLVCQKQKRISLTTHRSVPNTHWGQRLFRVFILAYAISRDFLSDIKFVLPIDSNKLHSLGYLHHILYIIFLKLKMQQLISLSANLGGLGSLLQNVMSGSY